MELTERGNLPQTKMSFLFLLFLSFFRSILHSTLFNMTTSSSPHITDYICQSGVMCGGRRVSISSYDPEPRKLHRAVPPTTHPATSEYKQQMAEYKEREAMHMCDVQVCTACYEYSVFIVHPFISNGRCLCNDGSCLASMNPLPQPKFDGSLDPMACKAALLSSLCSIDELFSGCGSAVQKTYKKLTGHANTIKISPYTNLAPQWKIIDELTEPALGHILTCSLRFLCMMLKMHKVVTDPILCSEPDCYNLAFLSTHGPSDEQCVPLYEFFRCDSRVEPLSRKGKCFYCLDHMSVHLVNQKVTKHQRAQNDLMRERAVECKKCKTKGFSGFHFSHSCNDLMQQCASFEGIDAMLDLFVIYFYDMVNVFLIRRYSEEYNICINDITIIDQLRDRVFTDGVMERYIDHWLENPKLLDEMVEMVSQDTINQWIADIPPLSKTWKVSDIPVRVSNKRHFCDDDEEEGTEEEGLPMKFVRMNEFTDETVAMNIMGADLVSENSVELESGAITRECTTLTREDTGLTRDETDQLPLLPSLEDALYKHLDEIELPELDMGDENQDEAVPLAVFYDDLFEGLLNFL